MLLTRIADSRTGRLTLVYACFMLLALNSAFGEESKSAPAGDTDNGLTPDAIQARLSQVPNLANLDDAAKNELTQTYNDVLKEIDLADDWAKKAAQFEDTQKSAPNDIADLESQAERRATVPRVEAPADATLPELEQLLAQQENELDDAKTAQAALDEEFAHRDERRKEIPDLIAAAKQRLSEVQAAAGEAPPESQAPELTDAKRALAAAHETTLKNELAAYDKELQSFDIRGRVLRLRVDAATLHVSEKEKLVAAWRDLVSRRREEEAKRAIEQARAVLMDAANASPQVREFAQVLADENADLVDRRTGPQGLLQSIERASELLQKLDADLAQVKSDFTGVTQKVEAAGLNNAIGHLLRRYKAGLPDLGQHRQDIRDRQDVIARVQMGRIEFNDQRKSLADIEGIIARYLSAPGLSTDPKVRAKLEGSLRSLLRAKRVNIDALLSDYDSYFDKLVDLDSTERELVSEAQHFSDYIDERVLWIRSGTSVDFADVRAITEAVGWLAGPGQWRSVWQGLRSDVRANPVLYAISVLVWAAALWGRWRCSRALDRFAELAQRSTCRSIRPTIETLLGTAFLSVPYVAVPWFLAWRLTGSGYTLDFGRAVGAGLRTSAGVLFAFEILRHTLRRKGLAESHFAWPTTQVRAIRFHALWFLSVTLLAMFFLSLLQWRGDETWTESLGRILLLGVLLASLLAAHLLLRSRKGAIPKLRHLLNPGGKSWWDSVMYAVGCGLPGALIVLTLSGYSYTAGELSTRLFATLCLAGALLLVHGVIVRWVLLARRSLSMEQARKRRELAQKREADDLSTEQEAEEHSIDLPRIDQQTDRIVQSFILVAFLVAAWFIWANETPALRALNRDLWHTTESVTQTVVDAEGKKTVETHERPVAVTLADLLLALVIGALTFIATANVPGFLELTVLQRMHFLKGERYAITTIVRYALGVLGFMLAFNALGIGWSKVQWLVAALGVGLGFGLQEIFANFISGLIILLERPIRVGDTVTVGGVSGTVSQIHMRATSITDSDGKELIVPNKQLVTGQVTNWTLTDSTLRVVVPVGIAYGSDTARAEQLLHQIARETPDVAADPAPQVVFTDFGDTALKFELRVFCVNVDVYAEVQHALHVAINKAFRDPANRVAFPQQGVQIPMVDAGSQSVLPKPSPSG